MKQITGLVCLLLILIAGCNTPAAVDSFTEADHATILAMVEGFPAATVEGRFADVAATYTEDNVFMPPYQDNVIGRAGLEAWFEAFPPIGEMEFTDVEITGSGDLAYVTGHFRMTFSPDGENYIEDRGTFLEVRVRGENSDWLVAADMFNSSLPLPAPE